MFTDFFKNYALVHIRKGVVYMGVAYLGVEYKGVCATPERVKRPLNRFQGCNYCQFQDNSIVDLRMLRG